MSFDLLSFMINFPISDGLTSRSIQINTPLVQCKFEFLSKTKSFQKSLTGPASKTAKFGRFALTSIFLKRVLVTQEKSPAVGHHSLRKRLGTVKVPCPDAYSHSCKPTYLQPCVASHLTNFLVLHGRLGEKSSYFRYFVGQQKYASDPLQVLGFVICIG